MGKDREMILIITIEGPTGIGRLAYLRKQVRKLKREKWRVDYNPKGNVLIATMNDEEFFKMCVEI